MYICKISSLSKAYKKIALLLRSVDQSQAGGALYSGERQQLSAEDKARFQELKVIKEKLKGEMRARG